MPFKGSKFDLKKKVIVATSIKLNIMFIVNWMN